MRWRGRRPACATRFGVVAAVLADALVALPDASSALCYLLALLAEFKL